MISKSKKRKRIDYNNNHTKSLKRNTEKKSNDISNKKLLKLLVKEIHELRSEIKQIDHLKQIIEDKDAIIMDLQKELELTRIDNKQPNYYY